MNEVTKSAGKGPSGDLQLHRLRPGNGAKKKRKRVGRGVGSGHGKTSCRGGKGQTARSGGNIEPGFEGGQMPLQRRLPKRGFHNLFSIEYQVVNVGQLETLAETEVTPAVLSGKRLVRRAGDLVKVLGTGALTRAVTVRAHAVSAAARQKIEAAGGRVELIGKA